MNSFLNRSEQSAVLEGIVTGVVKDFVDGLAKHKLLVYFVTLWGAMLFLITLYGMIEWGFAGFAITNASGVVDLFFHLSELFAGAVLVTFGVKLLSTNFLKAIKNERLLVYFLILWAASFFFRGLWDLIYYGPYVVDDLANAIALLGGLAALFAGVVLGLFSWKMLREPESQTAR